MDLFHSIKAIFWAPHALDKRLYSVYSRMTLIDKILFHIIHLVDRLYAWYKLPVFLGLLYLEIRRTLHQRYNLLNVGTSPMGIRYNPADHPYRTSDGKYSDPFDVEAGAAGTFFGRNMLPSPQNNHLLKPDPMVVATKLLARRKMIDTGKQFNMLAASWIQFMIHDWIDHLEETNQAELVAPESVAEQCPLKAFRFYKSKEVPTGFYDIKSGYINRRTAWWDGSAVYGSNREESARVRTFKDGKLKLGEHGLLLHESNGIAISGDVRNSWAGVSVLQALFTKEHNSVCDMLKKHYPHLDDNELYRHARLVTSAVIAKIHTIDWTVELLKTDTLLSGMRANWYGLLGKKVKDTLGLVRGEIIGIISQGLSDSTFTFRFYFHFQILLSLSDSTFTFKFYFHFQIHTFTFFYFRTFVLQEEQSSISAAGSYIAVTSLGGSCSNLQGSILFSFWLRIFSHY